ncbi:MAG: oxygenase MpaB family protein [Acidimicrobiales bacterium]
MVAPVSVPLERVRTRVAGSIRTLVAGSPEPPAPRQPSLEPGLFGPGSATWTVHADAAMFIGGLRALLMQTMHPLAMAGVADHSDYRSDPWGRLRRTGEFVGLTTFGSEAEANAIIDRVRRVHEHVRGTAPDGRAYAATDPHLLTWVHVTEVDSFLRAYQRYGAGTLSDVDADRYVAEMAQVAERLGADEVPRSVAEMEAWLQAVRPELVVGAQARRAVGFLLAPPVPLALRPVYGVIGAAAIGLLPPWARRKLWLPSPPLSDPLVVRPAARLLVGGLGWALRGDAAPSAR